MTSSLKLIRKIISEQVKLHLENKDGERFRLESDVRPGLGLEMLQMELSRSFILELDDDQAEAMGLLHEPEFQDNEVHGEQLIGIDLSDSFSLPKDAMPHRGDRFSEPVENDDEINWVPVTLNGARLSPTDAVRLKNFIGELTPNEYDKAIELVRDI